MNTQELIELLENAAREIRSFNDMMNDMMNGDYVPRWTHHDETRSDLLQQKLDEAACSLAKVDVS